MFEADECYFVHVRVETCDNLPLGQRNYNRF